MQANKKIELLWGKSCL